MKFLSSIIQHSQQLSRVESNHLNQQNIDHVGPPTQFYSPTEKTDIQQSDTTQKTVKNTTESNTATERQTQNVSAQPTTRDRSIKQIENHDSHTIDVSIQHNDEPITLKQQKTTVNQPDPTTQALDDTAFSENHNNSPTNPTVPHIDTNDSTPEIIEPNTAHHSTNPEINSFQPYRSTNKPTNRHDTQFDAQRKPSTTEKTDQKSPDVEQTTTNNRKQQKSPAKIDSVLHKIPTDTNKQPNTKTYDQQTNQKQAHRPTHVIRPPSPLQAKKQTEQTPQVRIGHINVLIEGQAQKSPKNRQTPQPKHRNPFGYRGL